MIHAKLGPCENLAQFYKELRQAQEQAHGQDYCAHHHEIYTCITNCRFDGMRNKPVVYKELGVNQGATAAMAAIAGAHHLHLIDINLSNVRPYLQLFHDHYEKTNPHAKVDIYEMSSLTPQVGQIECDVLFIDTVHHPDHVVKELWHHAPHCRRYIIIHDTGRHPEIHEAAKRFLPESIWGPGEAYTAGEGHSVFIRQEPWGR